MNAVTQSMSSLKVSYPMLTMKRSTHPTDEFQLPFSQGVMNVKDMIQMYPTFIEEMNGQEAGSCLNLFYERNPVNGVYTFRDEDAENDMADILGISSRVCSLGENE